MDQVGKVSDRAFIILQATKRTAPVVKALGQVSLLRRSTSAKLIGFLSYAFRGLGRGVFCRIAKAALIAAVNWAIAASNV